MPSKWRQCQHGPRTMPGVLAPPSLTPSLMQRTPQCAFSLTRPGGDRRARRQAGQAGPAVRSPGFPAVRISLCIGGREGFGGWAGLGGPQRAGPGTGAPEMAGGRREMDFGRRRSQNAARETRQTPAFGPLVGAQRFGPQCGQEHRMQSRHHVDRRTWRTPQESHGKGPVAPVADRISRVRGSESGAPARLSGSQGPKHPRGAARRGVRQVRRQRPASVVRGLSNGLGHPGRPRWGEVPRPGRSARSPEPVGPSAPAPARPHTPKPSMHGLTNQRTDAQMRSIVDMPATCGTSLVSDRIGPSLRMSSAIH